MSPWALNTSVQLVYSSNIPNKNSEGLEKKMFSPLQQSY
jgi:hypothetical protein